MPIKYAKPRGTIISLQRAKSIAASWHGGQWSPLYSFLSSYERGKNFAWIAAISEIDDTILTGKGAKYLSAADKRELNALKRFLIYKHYEQNKK
jgi:hypothetical protein